MGETTATGGPQPFSGEAWFDPLEDAVRTRLRGFIEELLAARTMVAWHAPSPSSPAPAAPRSVAPGLDRSPRPSGRPSCRNSDPQHRRAND